MRYIKDYEDYQKYLRENKQIININNTENMNEGWKHWLATFLMLVNLGIVPPNVLAAKDDSTKVEFTQSVETIKKVAEEFETYFKSHEFCNTPEYAWEDFQTVYGNSSYDLMDILKYTSIKSNDLENYEVNTDVPKPTNYLNDYGEMFIDQSREDALNNVIANYEKQSGIEIAILTINKYGSFDEINSFTHNVFKVWKPGKSASNNGILLVVSEKDRRARIETGYGAEIVLPDLACGRLEDSILVPNFKEGNYEKGITELVNAIISKIGTNSEDIKAFQNQFIAQKEAHEAKVKQGLLTAVEIIGVLAILIFLLTVIIRVYKKDKELRDRCKELIADFNLLLKEFEYRSINKNSSVYLDDIKKEFTSFMSTVDKVPSKPTTDQKVIDKLFEYNKKLGDLISKASKYNATYEEAKGSEKYIDIAKTYLNTINEIEKELSEYGETFNNNVTLNQVEYSVDVVKKHMSSKDIFVALSTLTGIIATLKDNARSIQSRTSSLKSMEDSINRYDKLIDSWIDKLKNYGLSEHIDEVNKMKASFIKYLSLPKSRTKEKYDALMSIKEFVDSKVEVIENERRRKEQERRRKEREEEEEEAARRRRNSYYSSSDSSYSSSSSSSSSDFGGFGGGSSGGGGASCSF